MNTPVLILVVAYNSDAALTGLLSSLVRQIDEEWVCVVAENGEVLTPAARSFAQADARITAFATGSNLGYLAAAQVAHDRMRELQPNWWVLSNADVSFEPDFVQSLRRFPPRVGMMCAPRILVGEGFRDLNPYMTTRPSVARSALRVLQVVAPLASRVSQRASEIKSSAREGRGNRRSLPVSTDIYAPHGAVVCISERFFDAGGTFNGGPFLFSEEVFLAEQTVELGGAITYQPSLCCRHYEHVGTGTRRSGDLARWQRQGAILALRLIVGARLRGWRTSRRDQTA